MRISYYNEDEEPAVKRFAENQTGGMGNMIYVPLPTFVVDVYTNARKRATLRVRKGAST